MSAGQRASLANIVDKGAYTDRVGYTHPTPAVRLRPTPCGPIGADGPGRSWRRPKINFVDKGAFTGRVGYAHPTDAPDDRLDPSQGRCP